MKVIDKQLNGLLLLQLDVFGDERGYFFESFHFLRYAGFGITQPFVQNNVSKSVKNTLRGLHYQVGNAVQGKLVQVLSGKVLDVAVDIRFGSPSYGKYFAAEISEENHYQLWIPPGFAHGFSVLSDEAIFSYKCTAIYSKKDERTILYNDADLNINWKISEPLLSPKDLLGKKFSEIEKDFFYNKEVL
ncbi:MAG: dTDP-4-dehydrorhamnose 3,5-epimerase [Ignavibacteria bacterium CG22_combo_CG10-13_8_21_14_all_37_15]|nr:dTDP-4-dehydrorhamnose 3,5-epimerase [Ignavibacteria bacterium]PIP78943.1 MAG: dTDP-4-dehydrorhamnose 3,5-epimerase [Ignavibacteria bacterium CG22_combo_CG10-13_8_21_14_all_37_15]PJC57024.1 MAG: dTDP-4-dehydrorhamnose 3,5-epimerase [Ignavibacteria bacterium CG_4_9_14_0_2_um_filter_37_13]